MRDNWTIRARVTELINKYRHLPALLTQIMHYRDLLIDKFNLSFKPTQMAGLEKAVNRIKQGIANQEKILVYGDYDVDGITSTVALVKALQDLNANVQHYIPTRADGYGVKREILEKYIADGVDLIITVDCGITAVQETADLNIDIIITDHHLPQQELPSVYTIVDPHQSHCKYPYKNLAGVGVVYKIIQALHPTFVSEIIDLVALGTIADLMPLTDENRDIVRYGLEKINTNPCVGIKMLLAENNKLEQIVNAQTISFTLAPCINAASRVGDVDVATQLLLTDDIECAMIYAQKLCQYNEERKHSTIKIVEQATFLMEKEKPEYIIILTGSFQQGFIGLACSKLVDDYQIPVAICSVNGDIANGSMRGCGGFHVLKALQECSDLMLRFGGHSNAGGFSLKTSNIPLLKSRLQKIAIRHFVNQPKIQNKIIIDGKVNLKGVDNDLVEQILSLAPFGVGNPTPLFLSTDLIVKNSSAVGEDKKHLKFTVNDGNRDWPCIAFGFGYLQNSLASGSMVDIVYSFEYNFWKGKKTIQLMIKDMDIL